jgi:beta-phosphoglucomutase
MANFPFAAVLFDLDGVIINTTPLHYRVWDTFARSHGYTPTQAELLATNGVRSAETMRRWLGSHLSDAEIERYTIEQSAYINELLETDLPAAIPGVHDYVASLAAAVIPRAIATSARVENAKRYLEKLKLTSQFDTLITSADVSEGKPHPAVYLKAAAALRVDPTKCVVIEDSVSGIQSAKAAGARCIALTTTFSREVLAAQKPDWLFSDFTELPAELRPQM